MDEFQSMPALAGLEQAPRLSQTAEEITTPSAMTSFRGALYTATDLLPTQTITDFWQSRVVMPYISDRDRPKLDQTKVDTLIAGAGLDNFKLDASKYNDVGIYFLIENQKHRQAAARIDSLTTPSWTGTPSRAIAQFIVPMFDPANIIAGFFPAATLARGAGLMSIAGKLEGLAALTTTATTLPGRVGARAALGAVEGLVGNIPIEAMQAPMRTEMGEDYKATDSLLNLAMGSAVGGGLHVITGGLARGVKARGQLLADHVEAQTPEVKATMLTPDGTPNMDAVKSFQHAELSKVIPTEQAMQLLDTSPRIAERLTDAVIPTDNVIMRDTIDLVNGVKSINEATPESRIMADYLDAPVTTPRMISEVMTDYHDAVNQAVKLGEEVNHVELLQSAINRVQPTAAELSAAVTPQTRENVIKTAIAQTLDDRMPTVDAMLRADERIGTATLDDVKTELKQSNSPDNKLGTMGDRTMAVPDQTLKYADEVDLDAHIAQTEAKIKEMEELQKLGLYSRKPYHGTPYDIEKFDTAKIDIEILRKYSRILGDNTGIKSTELVSQLYNDFGDDAGRLLETGKIKIVESVKDLPGTHPADVKGVTFRDGQVYLVAENLSPEQIKGVVLHEIGVHVNMQNMLGDTGYNNLIKQLDNLLGENNSMRDALDFAVPKDTPSQYVAQEKLAYLIENAPNSGFVREILANIKAWLFKTFPSLQTKLNLGEADFAALGLSSFRNYARQGTVADFNARPALYSTVDEIVDHTTNDLDAINNVLNKVDDYRAAFETILPEMGDIADNGVFYDLVNKSIRMTKQEAKETLFTYQQALRRETELGNPAADQAALDFLMKNIKGDLLASKKSTLWDKGRNIANEKFMEKMLDLPKAVARALTISTANQRPGTMAVNPAAEVVSIKARYQASIEAKLDEAGVMKLVENNVMNDDVMRAMDAIQRNDTEKLKTLSPESQKIARIIEDTYDSILTEMNQTGLSENKIKGYYFNQSYSHDQLRINDTPEAEWIADATKLYRNKKTAEAYNIAISDMDESWFKELYRKMSTGEHDSGSYKEEGGFGGFSAAEPLRRVTTKQRKLIANDVEGAIRYHNKYGKQDLYGAISGTLDAQAKKLGLVKTLGVNYERNLMQIMDKLNKKIIIPEQRKDFKSWANHHVPEMIRAVDGRMDIPVSGMLARSSSNVRAIISMAMISKSAVAGFIGDGLNGAIQDRKLGIGSLPLPLQFVKRMAMQFKHYTPEQKGIARAMGVATENLLMDAHRYNSLENNVSGIIAKASRWFYKLNLIDKQGTQMKLATVDQLANAHAAFAQIPYDELGNGVKRYLQRHDITAEDWGIIKHAQTKHVDGKDYLTPDTIKDLIPQARELVISKGATQEVADIAAQKYITNLQAKMSKYYLDLLAHQYLEPTAASKFFAAFGRQAGTVDGERNRFATQFKQYGINFWRNILLDEVYSRHDTAGAFAKDLFTTKEGFKQGAGILWKVANFTLAGYMSWALYDIIAGRKPRALINEDGTLSKAAIAGSLMKSGGLSIFADFLFADYNRFGTSIEGMAAGPAINVLGSVAKNLNATSTGSYKTFTGEKQSPDVGARWLKFAKDLSPGVFWGSAISNYAFWYGMQEKLNPGYLHRMERNMKNLSDQEYIFPPSQNAIEY